ncbi:MAG TPA: HpcH/HpaI aldolase/citrate lyase family protein [Candidatus Methylomirabilis sp.]|nr:HpcH/HpaI aldolase/citrate lyase family protein [Candidatus Methylomirabilis sp.]
MTQPFENRVKRLLKAGKKSAGAWAQLCSPLATEILSRGGFDWILIDMEHAPGDVLTLVSQCQAMAAAGAVPIVRSPWNDLVWIKRILDAGAYGVMIPSINTREQAVTAVRACKYPPAGVRGIAGSPRAAGYGRDTANYLKRANDEILVILQVETPEAIQNLEEIGKVPGVDMLFIGPMDLSTSMGHFGNPGHPEVQAAIATIEAKAKAIGVPLGTISAGWEQAKALYDRGYQLITLLSDSVLISKAGADIMAKFREAFPEG